MKKIITLLCVCLLVLTGCRTKQEQKVLPALEPDQYLYEVKDNQGNHLYLLGTMHVGAQPITFDGQLKKAYDASDTIAFEIEMVPTQQQINQMNQALMKYPLQDIKNENFEDIWEDFDSAYQKVNESAKQYGVMYAASLANNEIWEESHISNQYGIDMTLYKQALEDQKDIKEIEGYDLQINVLERIGEKAPMLMLISMIDKDNQTEMLKQMITSYSEGSIDENMFDDESIHEEDLPEKYRTGTLQQELKDYNDIMISSRNDDMLEKAVGYLENNDTLLAVGAGHVVGKTGLVQQLKDAGYQVEKVK